MNGREGANCKMSSQRRGGGGRLHEKISHLSPLPSDGDPVTSFEVSKVSTGGLVSIGYGAVLESENYIYFKINFESSNYTYFGQREYVLSGRCAAVMENGRPAARNQCLT